MAAVYSVCAVLVLFLGMQHVTSRSLDTLFAWEDPIAQMVDSNLSSTVHGSDKVWAVDFYATWCGHCQRFAPYWKRFANEMKAWSRLVGVGSVACSDPQNNQLCLRYNIWAYPSIRFFVAKAPVTDKGYNHPGNKYDLDNVVIDMAERTPVNQRPASWPKLHPASSVAEVRRELSGGRRVAFIIFENTNSTEKAGYLGRQVILDMSGNPTTIVRRMDTLAGSSRGVTGPSVYRLLSNGDIALISRSTERKEVVAAIKESLSGRQVVVATTSPPPSTTAPPAVIPDGLHMQDLESSVYYSLWQEVGKQRIIRGPALRALKDYLEIMAKYHPGRVVITNFLKRLSRWLQRQRTAVSADRWRARLVRITSQNAHVPKRVLWTGCRGSASRYRGYPCSLWMTFHAVTVNAYLKDGRGRDFEAKDVLVAVREYIRNFFGCRHCAGHFTNMTANVERELRGRQAYDGVLWLWRGHNKVNKRLAGDVTEDPSHPKVQFPVRQACAGCRTRSGFDDTTTLTYLLNFYRPDKIIQDVTAYATPTRAPRPYAPRVGPTRAPCRRNVTSWSGCSRSCGAGLSKRYSNENAKCEAREEIRICNLRPCGAVFPQDSDCQQVFQAGQRERIQYHHCYSASTYQQRFCNKCAGRCCYPSSSRTIRASFICRKLGGGYGRISAQVWWIESCACARECPTTFTDRDTDLF